MLIQRFETNERSSQAVACNGFVFLAGQVARDAPNAPIDVQTRDALKRVDALLAKAGSDKTRLVSAVIWMADIREFPAMNAVWVDWLPPGGGPARAVIESRLAYPEFRVEIGIIAAAKP